MSRDLAREVLSRYERRLELLEAEAGTLRVRLAEAESGIQVLGRAVDAQRAALDAYPDLSQGGTLPDQRTYDLIPQESLCPTTNQSDNGNVVAMHIEGTRREHVLILLRQDPTRWWKVRDIADALKDDNQKSLRVTISKMVQQGEVIKVRTLPRSAWFRYNDGVDRPAPRGDRSDHLYEPGAAM